MYEDPSLRIEYTYVVFSENKISVAVYRVRINGSHFAICEEFLRFCEPNFIQKYKKCETNENSLKSSQKNVGKTTRDTQSSNVHFDC